MSQDIDFKEQEFWLKKNILEKLIKKLKENAWELEEKKLQNLQEISSNHLWNSENKKKPILKIS